MYRFDRIRTVAVALLCMFALPAGAGEKLTQERVMKLELDLAGKRPAQQFQLIEPWLKTGGERIQPLVLKVFRHVKTLPLEYQQKLVAALIRHPHPDALKPAVSIIDHENVELARAVVKLVARTGHRDAEKELIAFFRRTRSSLLRMDVLTALREGDSAVDLGLIEPGKDPVLGKQLFLRTRLVSAKKAPKQITVGFRRGLYWKRAGTLGTVGMGQWTDWADSRTLLHGKGGSAFLVVEFPGCMHFSAEYQLACGGKILKTISEQGEQKFSIVVVPEWLVRRRGVDPFSDEFAAAFQSLTDFMEGRLARFDRYFKGRDSLPRKYAFEANYGGYVSAETTGRPISISGRHSSAGAVRAELRMLRHLGYNSFIGENSLFLAEQFGMRDQFNRMVTFSAAQAPWYQIPCPFSEKLDEKGERMVETATRRAKAIPDVKDIWIHWGDEIGVVAKADHIRPCPVCRAEFHKFAQRLGLTPRSFGKEKWDELIPFADWKPGMPTGGSWPCKTAAEAANLYYSMRFMNVATALVYTETSRVLKKRGIRVSPLRGPSPSWNGHSSGWFEFYDATPDTAITWETSNRDPRVWQWCSYLASMTRSIGRRHGEPVHVYVKPHRGAPTQRLLSVLSRGVHSICWYNYGPPYAQGDEFTSPHQEKLMFEVGDAARMAGRAEGIIYGAERVPETADVALLYPRSSFNLRRGYGHTNHFQDAKWVYLALRHAHVPVDVVDEAMIEDGTLAGRRALYIVGSHLRESAAKTVLEWTRAGGTVWMDIEGASRNELNATSDTLVELTGQGARDMDLWGLDPGYRATKLPPFRGTDGTYEAPKQAAISAAPLGIDGELRGAIGRETLSEKDGKVLATFRDGRPGVLVRQVGKGRVYLVATFAGLAYSEEVRRMDFDMGRDLKDGQRNLIAFAAIAAGARRPAVPSDPLVEAVLVRNGADAALYLMNWHYRNRPNEDGKTFTREHVEKEDVRVALPALLRIGQAATAGGHHCTLGREGAKLTLTLPRLGRGEIVLLKAAHLADGY